MTYKSVFAYLGNVKLRPFAKSTESKAVNARDEFRGLYLFGRLGSRRPHITVRKKSHVFYARKSEKRKSEKKVSPQGLGQKKKQIQKMKTIITRLILATLLISGGKAFAQKDGFSLHLSGVFPNGKFAEFEDNDKVCALVNGSSKTGSAGAGFGVGFKYQFPISQVANLRFLVGAELMYNPLNGDAKDWFDDEFDSGKGSGDGLSYDYDYEVSMPKYLNVPLMAGLNYSFNLNDKINIFGEFAAGINMRLFTNAKLLREREGIGWYNNGYTTVYYDFTDTYELIYKYDNAIAFAYRFGAGITFDKISIGLHWYNLGTAKVKGKVSGKYDYKDSEGDTEHDSDKENFKWKDLSISMMTLTVGYHF